MTGRIFDPTQHHAGTATAGIGLVAGSEAAVEGGGVAEVHLCEYQIETGEAKGERERERRRKREKGGSAMNNVQIKVPL